MSVIVRSRCCRVFASINEIFRQDYGKNGSIKLCKKRYFLDNNKRSGD